MAEAPLLAVSRRTHALLIGAEIVVAAVIAYLFIVVLMTAAAQQRVVVLLDQQNSGLKSVDQRLDYSAAYARVKLAKKAELQISSNRAIIAALTKDSGDAGAKVLDAQQDANDAWDGFGLTAARIPRGSGCGPDAATATDLQARHDVWNAVVQCLKDGSLNGKLAEQLKAAINSDDPFGPAYNTWLSAKANLDRINANLKPYQDQNKELSDAVQSSGSLRDVFSEFDSLWSSWLLAGALFIPLPPSMMQIILAAFAGAFGSVLITLILIVYPDNQFSAASTREFAARVFLGGLISLAAYIVLGGGAAILGSSPFGDQTKSNYMTFAAVGMFAGMFSDRVAAWMSTGANQFFGRQQRSDKCACCQQMQQLMAQMQTAQLPPPARVRPEAVQAE
jgi:hypothetical protein